MPLLCTGCLYGGRVHSTDCIEQLCVSFMSVVVQNVVICLIHDSLYLSTDPLFDLPVLYRWCLLNTHDIDHSRMGHFLGIAEPSLAKKYFDGA